MPAWLLLVLFFLTWCLWAFAALIGRAADDALRGVPEGQRGGVSLTPVIPVFPLVLWAAAVLIDRIAAGPWGTRLIGGAHAVLATVFALGIVQGLWRLRRLGNPP